MRSIKFSALSLFISFISFASYSNTLTHTPNNFTFSFVEGNRFDFDSSLDFTYRNNHLNQTNNKQSTSSQKVATTSYLQLHNDVHLLQANLYADYLWFKNFNEDNHDELDSKLKYFYKVNDLHRAFLSASYKTSFEYRGTGSTKGLQLIADKGQDIENTLLNVGYLYGRSDSVSKLSIVAGNKSKEYKTKQRNNEQLNYDTNFAEIDLDYLITGKTYMNLLISYQDVQFSVAKDNNRTELSVLAGLKWEPSQLSKLTALIGYETLDFEQTSIENRSKFKWLIAYDWRPLQRLRVNIDSGRAAESSVDVSAAYVIKDSVAAKINYDLNDFTNLSLKLNYSTEDITFIDKVITEQVLTTEGELNYNLNSSITLYAGISSNSVNSDISVYEYDSLLFNVGINGQF